MKKRTQPTAWIRTISTGVFAALVAVVLLTLVMPTQAKAVCDVHSWGNWWTVQQPTCTEAGMEQRSCHNCDTNEDRAIPATGHSWGTPRIELEPTCTSAGKGRHSCAKCRTRGELFEIPALGHDWVTVENTPGTCIRPARTVKQCSRCGEQDITEGAYGTHAWGAWQTTEATCTANGESVRYCTTCADGVEHKTIFAYGHKMVPDETVKGTCVTEGYVSVKCTRCGHTEKESTGYGGHVWGAWETREATCTNDGEKVRYCTKCTKGVQRETLPALGHNMVPGDTVIATCIQWGYDSTKCTRCGYEERTNDSWGTHYWGDWTDDPENLIKFRICKRCGERAEAPINASLQLKAERLTPIQLRQDAAASGERTYAVDFDVTFTNTGDLPLFGCLAELIFASDGIALGEAVSVETYTVLEKGESISATITFTIAPDLFETKIAPNIGQDGVFTDIIFLAEALTVDTWKTVSDSMQLACPVIAHEADHITGSTRILSPDLKLTMWTEIGDRPVKYDEWVNYHYRVENTGDEAVIPYVLMSGFVNGSYGRSWNTDILGETLQPGETSQEYYVSFRPNILTIGENDQGEKGMKLSFYIRGYRNVMDETWLESNECSFWNPLEGEANPMLSVEFVTATVESDTVASWWMLTNPGNMEVRLKSQEVLDLTGKPAEYDRTYLEGDMIDGWVNIGIYQLFCLEFPITAEDTAAGHCYRSVQYTAHPGDGALTIQTDDYSRDDRYDQSTVIVSNIAVMDIPLDTQTGERPALLLSTTSDPMNGTGVTIGQQISRTHRIFNLSDAPIRLEGLYALETDSPIVHFIDQQLQPEWYPECSTWAPTVGDVTDWMITQNAAGERGVDRGYYAVGYTADGQKVVSNTFHTWHPLAEGDASTGAFVGTLFVGKTYTAGGVSMDAAEMGKAYTIILNADGTVTYTMADVEIPGFTWKTADDCIEVEAYGNVVMTLTMQTDGTMLLDYNGAFTLLMEPQQ